MIRAARGLAVAVALAVALLLPAIASGQQAALPQGEPEPGQVLEDPDFGVRTDQFGLDRRVEMLQWQREPGGGYRQVWSSGLVDSTGFDKGYENVPGVPLESRRWWAEGAMLDGKPLDLSVLKTLGQWQEFRPAFSRLPANLAATFQPEGNGLASSDNPLEPRIGDLRIRWRELQLPPLAGRVELVDGAWQVSAGAENAALNARPLPPAVNVDGNALPDLRLRILLGGGVLLLLVVLVVVVRRLRR